jgi:DDE family transposase
LWSNIADNLHFKGITMPAKEQIVSKLNKFRHALYSFFNSRRDASMDLVDAISGNRDARSVAELSLSPLNRRNYASITRVVDEYYPETGKEADREMRRQHDASLEKILAAACTPGGERKFHLFATDVTPNSRPHAETLEDRTFVHAPTVISGNKPVTIGHDYSVTVYLPEKMNSSSSWVLPVSCLRVESDQRGPITGMNQILECIRQAEFQGKLCVSVTDCAYSQPECIWMAGQSPSLLVHVSRLRSNRVLHRIAEPASRKKRGRKTRFGKKFRLNDRRTHGNPDNTETFLLSSNQKKIVRIASWDNLLMRGKRQYRMDAHPLRLLKIEMLDTETGDPLYKKSLWLVVSGQKRNELSLQEVFMSYRQRFDIEHFFRFGKNRLLIDKFQTPDTVHEEAWWWLCITAYVQLFLARDLAQKMPAPWEKYLPQFRSGHTGPVSPTQTQKDFTRIIRQIGTPALAPKTRKKSAGRGQGETQIKRIRFPVIRKGKNHKKTKKRAA